MKATSRPYAVAGLSAVAGPLGAMALAWLHGTTLLHVPQVALSLRGALLMLFVAPLVEEFAFRGALMDGLSAMQRRLRVTGAPVFGWPNLITSLVFVACHLPYYPAPLACTMLLPSLLLGRVREVTGSVLPCVLLHAWFNACFLILFTK